MGGRLLLGGGPVVRASTNKGSPRSVLHLALQTARPATCSESRCDKFGKKCLP